MKNNSSKTDAIIDKMEELYEIKFNPYIYICSEDNDIDNTYSNLLQGSEVKKRYKYRVKISSIEFQTIYDIFSATCTAEFSISNPINIGKSEIVSLTPIFCFTNDDNTIFLDVQNVLFLHMLNYTKVQLCGDERQRDFMEEYGMFEEQRYFIRDFC